MYVMSPFTSLLVLETDADYERFKVDRGRKDHWAMYQCPPKVPLVYEPEGKAPPKEEKPEVRKNGKPTVGEVLATMAPSEANGAAVIPLRSALASDVAVVLNKAFGGNALIVPHVKSNSLIVRAMPIDLLTIRRLVDTQLDGPAVARSSVQFVTPNFGGPMGGGNGASINFRQYDNEILRHLTHIGGTPDLDDPLPTQLATFNGRGSLNAQTDHIRVLALNPAIANAAIESSLAKFDAVWAEKQPLRGFLDLDGSVTGSPGTFVGSKQEIVAGADAFVLNRDRVDESKLSLRDRAILQQLRVGTSKFDGRGVEEFKIAEGNLARLGIFEMDEKPLAGVGEVFIVGNSVRQDRVIRRQLGYDKDTHANDEMFIDLLKHNTVPQPLVSVLVWDGKLTGNEEFGTEIGLQAPILFNRGLMPVAPQAGKSDRTAPRSSMLYERLKFDYDRTLFTDLLQYAPGLHTAYADVLATLEAEADVFAPKLGSIDSAARKLIDKARSSDWQTLAIPAHGPIPGYTIHFNGIGQFTYERILGSGLGEKVICDGKTLYHLYPEIGLASKRAFSRHHHDLASAINPAFLPAAEELARGCDVKAIDANTVAVSRQQAAGSIHLVFAKDGRLSERRVVEAGKTLLRQIFHADGSVEWQDEKGKSLAKQPRSIASAKTPNLVPDVSDLVVIQLPIRTAEHIIGQAKKRDIDPDRDVSVMRERFVANCFSVRPVGPNGEQWHDFARLFEEPKNRKLGYYVLMNAPYAPVNAACEDFLRKRAGKKWQPLDPEKEHPGSALAVFVSQGQREQANNANPSLPPLPGPKDGFIQKLGRFRDLWLTWHNQRPAQNPAELPTHKAKVMEFLQDTSSPLFAYAILDTMQRRCNIAPSDRMMEIAVKRFGPITSPVGLGYVGRYEYARSLYQAGLSGEAGKHFRDLYADTLKLGMLPPIDADFRAAVRAAEFVGFIRANADTLIEKKRFGLAFQMAAQMDQLGDAALCDEVLAAILAKASDKERNAVTLVCVQFQAERKNFAQADRLLGKLLADKELAQHSELWRGRSHIVKQLGQTAESVRCLEKALDLEYAELPEIVNLESIRADYRVILEHYQRIAEASASLEKLAPPAFLAKVIRTADRWRLIDPEAAEPCKLAGKILATCGARDLAWDYWTTPIDLHPAESRPWLELAETLQAEGDLERADRAFALGFEAEPTNPELLWKRAQNLARLGQPEPARTLYRQIADGSWQARFNTTVEQARGLAGK